MELESKKRNILRWIPLGLDAEEAYLAAECTEEEIEVLKKDEVLQRSIEIHKLMEEKRLLKLHKKAMEIAAGKGNTQGIQWKLSKMKPVKWGDGKRTDENNDRPLRIIFESLPKNTLIDNDDIDIVEKE